MAVLRVCGMYFAAAIALTGIAQQRYSMIVDRILDAWKTADVVCLGEDHDRYNDNELRLAIVRHPAFPRTVRAIVVEMANPVHQDVLDRFALDGVAISREELAPVWRDATNPEVWESPIYEELLRAVRDVNLAIPRDRRVRILAGDSRVDWSAIKRPEELIPLMNRGGNIRELIASQVMDTHLKVLAIYGAGHCSKVGTGFPGELAERYGKDRFWSISPLVRTAGVERGRAVFGLGEEPAYIAVDPRWSATPAENMLIPALSRFSIGQVYDAIIYHGNVPDRVVEPDLSTMRETWEQSWIAAPGFSPRPSKSAARFQPDPA